MLAEKIYLSFYIQVLIIIAFYILITGSYSGELHSFLLDISIFEVLILMIYSILSFVLLYYVYKIMVKKKLTLKSYKFRFNIKKFANFYFILLIISFIFMLSTGVGVVLSHATSPYSVIFNLFNVSVLFPIFYFLLRKSEDINIKYFWTIVIVFILYKLLQGWSGIIFTIFIFEVYFYYKDRYINKIKQIVIILLLPLIFILVGAKVYQEIYPIKNEIRGLGYHEIDYSNGLVKLVNRLTYFSISVGAYSKIDEIKEFYKKENIVLKESIGTFRPITPRFIMENKEFRSLNNNVLQPFFNDITPYTSSDIGIIMYAVNLFNASLLDGIVWIIILIIILFSSKFVYDNLSQYNGQFNFLFFILILKICTTASPEIIVGYYFFGILYFIPVLFILGILKLKIRKQIAN